MGYPRERREACARRLGDLFGPSTGDEFLRPLVEPCRVEELEPFLEVGANLELPNAWDDAHLITRLRNAAEFEDAALELRVLANAFRGGYRPRRIPRGGRKTADFLVRIGAVEEFELEVKGRGEVELARLGEELNQRLANAAMTVPGFHLELQGDAELYERARRDRLGFAQSFDTIVEAFTEAVQQVRSAGSPPPMYEVPPFGRILAEPGGQSVTPDILADVPVDARAEQALKLVRKGNSQFSSRKGIVFLDVRRRADVASVARTVIRSAGGLGRCRMVVLADTLPDAVVPTRAHPIVRAVPVPTERELSKALLTFATVVAGRRGENARPVGANVYTGHTRTGITTVKLTEHYRQPDGMFQVPVGDLIPRGRQK
jgi:hypothetical protein